MSGWTLPWFKCTVKLLKWCQCHWNALGATSMISSSGSVLIMCRQIPWKHVMGIFFYLSGNGFLLSLHTRTPKRQLFPLGTVCWLTRALQPNLSFMLESSGGPSSARLWLSGGVFGSFLSFSHLRVGVGAGRGREEHFMKFQLSKPVEIPVSQRWFIGWVRQQGVSAWTSRP